MKRRIECDPQGFCHRQLTKMLRVYVVCDACVPLDTALIFIAPLRAWSLGAPTGQAHAPQLSTRLSPNAKNARPVHAVVRGIARGCEGNACSCEKNVCSCEKNACSCEKKCVAHPYHNQHASCGHQPPTLEKHVHVDANVQVVDDAHHRRKHHKASIRELRWVQAACRDLHRHVMPLFPSGAELGRHHPLVGVLQSQQSCNERPQLDDANRVLRR